MLSKNLASEGHALAVAARELQGAHQFFSGMHVQYYQAPFKQGQTPELQSHLSYAHLLYTSGYANPRELAVMLSAWFGILTSFRPDAVVFEHSPTALLASRALNVRRSLIGSGFVIPPIETPLGLFPDTPRTAEILKGLRSDEQLVLDVVNQAIRPFGMGELANLSEIYHPVDVRFLLTFPELDPFSQREPSEYYGVWPVGETRAPDWPSQGEKRIFAYISTFPSYQVLLRDLKSIDAAVLIYAPGIPLPDKHDLSDKRLRFADELTNLDDVAADCDLFVSHGSHTSVARTLLKGIPQFMIPKYKEQLFTARRVSELGAGVFCGQEDKSYRDAITTILNEPKYREAAQRFSHHHREFDPASSADKVAMKLRVLLT